MTLQSIFIVRHAETVLDGRYCGSMDVSLSQKGFQQIKNLAKFFKNIPMDICLSSDLIRASTTAKEICSDRIPIQYEPQIREISFGEWEGKSFKEVQQSWTATYDSWIKNPVKTKIPGGEPFAHFSKRIVDFATQLKSTKEPKILVVAHGGVISVLLMTLLGYPLTQFWDWAPPLASIAELRRGLHTKNSQFEIVRLRDISHIT